MNKPTPITAKIVSEYGAEFPQAIVYILDSSMTFQDTTTAADINADLVDEIEIIGFSYSARYFVNAQTKAQGFDTCPVRIKDETGYTTVLTPDMDNPQIQQILDSSATNREKKERIAQADIRHRFK